MRFHTPLALSIDPQLDLAFVQGYDAWLAAVRDRGANAAARWIARRSIEVKLDENDLYHAIVHLLRVDTPVDLVAAEIGLAEMIQAGDVELAQLFWFAVRDYALANDDVDMLAGATSRIAEIAFELDEVQDGGQAWLDLLNWRRKPGSVSDPELVMIAFDQILVAAEMTGAHRDAAHFTYLQVKFQQVIDQGDEKASTGNWMADDEPLVVWS